MPEMNSSMIYMPLKAAQTFYSAPDRLTSLSLSLRDKKKMKSTANYLQTIDPDDIEVMTWREMMPQVVQAIQGDNIGGQVMLGILYLVVGFGIFGTIMMMTIERKREFGIMVAVGMRRAKLALIVFIESISIAIVGVLCGGILSLPVILYLHYHPIQLTGELAKAVLEYNMEPVLPFALEPGFFISQSLVVFILSLLAAIYPLMVIKRFRIITALRSK
jgi:ABC-type lipoprotein release transport system permease subunit